MSGYPFELHSSSRRSSGTGRRYDPYSSSSNPYISGRDPLTSSRHPHSSRTSERLYGIGLYDRPSSSRSSQPMRLAEPMHPPRAGSFSREIPGPRLSTASDRRAFENPYYIGPGYGPDPRSTPYAPSRRRSNSEARQYLPNRNPSYFEVRQPFRDLYSSNSGQREYYSGTGTESSYHAGGYTSRRPSTRYDTEERYPTSTARRPWR